MPKKPAKKNSYKIWDMIKGFFSPLQIPQSWYTPEPTARERSLSENALVPPGLGDNEEDVHRRNATRLELQRMEQERQAVNSNLRAQHRLMVVTVLTALVAH
jgi:hypothetical protein